MTDNQIVFKSLNDKLTAMERLNDSVEDTRIRQDMSGKIVDLRLQLKDVFGVPRLRRDLPTTNYRTEL